ncbi:MAG: TatD family hydrolase [Planctomycetota bacterium]
MVAPAMIDTHCHLTYDGLHDRVDEVIAAAQRNGVDRMITVGTTPNDAAKAAALAERHENVFFTAGLHPGYSGNVTDHAALKEGLRSLLAHPRVVAIGEMGLDRHYPDPPMDKQRPAFAAQLELMQELAEAGRPLPGVVHTREIADDTLAMIADHGVAGERLVFHCFTGTADEVERILATGAMVSFTGIVTFNGAKAVAEMSDRVPLDRLMIETDSPYLTPAPYRKIKTNEPKYVRYVAEFLAERRGLSLDEFVAAMDANAERFFGLIE